MMPDNWFFEESWQELNRAQGIEARSGETRMRLDPKDESPVGSEAGDAPNPSRSNQSMVELTLKPEDVALECSDCGAQVAVWCGVLCCHCRTVPWKYARIDTPPSSSTEEMSALAGPSRWIEELRAERAKNDELAEALQEAIQLLDDCEITHPFRWENALAKPGREVSR